MLAFVCVTHSLLAKLRSKLIGSAMITSIADFIFSYLFCTLKAIFELLIALCEFKEKTWL